MGDFNGPYGNPYGPPHRLHPMDPVNMGPPPGSIIANGMEPPAYIDNHLRHGFAGNYRDTRLPSTYRQTPRDPYLVNAQPSGSSSPSYKILCITNINGKIDDMSVKEALLSDFCSFGDISVSICHDGGERLAYIYFRSNLEAREARLARTGAILFDRPIEIEPIFEPRGSPTDGLPARPSPLNNVVGGPAQPVNIPPAMVVHQHPVFSPRGRRSMTPPEYEMNGLPLDHRRPLTHHHHQLAPNCNPPTPPMHFGRTISPPEFVSQQHTSGYGSHGPSPSPLSSDLVGSTGYAERRVGGGQYQQHLNHSSTYSSSPHESYRSSYPSSGQHLPQSQHHHHQPSQSYPHHHSSRAPLPPTTGPIRPGRERVYADGSLSTRSSQSSHPYSHHSINSYHRGPPLPTPGNHTYHNPARSSSHHYTAHQHRSSSNLPHATHQTYPHANSHNLNLNRSAHYNQHHLNQSPMHRHRPGVSPPLPHRYSSASNHLSSQAKSRLDPPMRFMSREYRRERLGISDPNEPTDIDEGRPSRVLLVSNIDTSKTEQDLRELFESPGIIEEIEIKKVTSELSSALIKFSSMDGAYKAKMANQGRYIGGKKCSIVYGKVSASRRLWIGGLNSSTSVLSMEDECSKYGDIINLEYTSGRPYCYVEFSTPNQAQFAAHHMISTLVPAPDRKVRIEFVDPERSEKMARFDCAGDSKPQTTTTATNNTTGNLTNSAVASATTPTTGSTSDSPWVSHDRDTSPQSGCGSKRSSSPGCDHLAFAGPKRHCSTLSDLPYGANTFKQERLAAAAAAKARTTSNASSTDKSSSDQMISAATTMASNRTELNNNSNGISEGGDSCPHGQDLSDEKHVRGEDGVNEYKTVLDDGNVKLRLQEAPSLELLAQCSVIRDVVLKCSVSWPTQIALRNFIFPSRMYMVGGRKEIIDKYLTKGCAKINASTDANGFTNETGSVADVNDDSPPLKINQRWRLHPQPKLDEVQKRMQLGNLGLLIIVARQEAPTSKANQNQTPALQHNGRNDNPLTPNNSNETTTSTSATNTTLSSSYDQKHQQQDDKRATDVTVSGAGPAETNFNESSSVVQEGREKQIAPDGSGDYVHDSEENSVKNTTTTITPSVPASSSSSPPASNTQSRPLRNLISYLEQKDAAGVISLTSSEQTTVGVALPDGKLLYAFPPCEFALNLVKHMAPNLKSELVSREEFLLGVIVGTSVEGKTPL